MSPQIQDPALAERLRRRFSIVGSSAIDTIAPELVGVVVVDELIPSRERREALFSVEVTGDTADIAEIALQNTDPVNSLVLDWFSIGGNASGEYRFRALTVQGTLVAGGVVHASDTRGELLVPAITPTAKNLNSTTGGGQIYWEGLIAANTTLIVYPNFVIAPAGTLLGAVLRDFVHFDMGTAASKLVVSGGFHYVSPVIGSGS